jgi:hypothetical protein
LAHAKTIGSGWRKINRNRDSSAKKCTRLTCMSWGITSGSPRMICSNAGWNDPFSLRWDCIISATVWESIIEDGSSRESGTGRKSLKQASNMLPTCFQPASNLLATMGGLARCSSDAGLLR